MFCQPSTHVRGVLRSSKERSLHLHVTNTSTDRTPRPLPEAVLHRTRPFRLPGRARAAGRHFRQGDGGVVVVVAAAAAAGAREGAQDPPPSLWGPELRHCHLALLRRQVSCRALRGGLLPSCLPRGGPAPARSGAPRPPGPWEGSPLLSGSVSGLPPLCVRAAGGLCGSREGKGCAGPVAVLWESSCVCRRSGEKASRIACCR